MLKFFKSWGWIVSIIADLITILSIQDKTINPNMYFVLLIINVPLVIVILNLCLKMNAQKNKGNIIVDGIVLTVISQKNITRSKNKDFEVSRIEYNYEFSDMGFDSYIRFAGKVKKIFGSVKGIYINCSGDSNQSFENIQAFAYNLSSDPNQRNKIYAESNMKEGLNKDVFFKFDHPLKKNERFDYLFHYRWDNCVNPKKDYIAAIPPFDTINPNTLSLNVKFKDMDVNTFETYSIYNFKAKYENRIAPETDHDGYIIYRKQYTISDNFNFAVAVFKFN